MSVRYVIAVALALTACADEAPPVPTAAAATPAPADEHDPAQVPGAVYRQAHTKAQKEINADNARERLAELERQIDLDRQSFE
jgi:hypothetical protein